MGQRYNSPEYLVLDRHTDLLIVGAFLTRVNPCRKARMTSHIHSPPGRGICQQKDRLAAAKAYRKAGWDAYLRRLQISDAADSKL